MVNAVLERETIQQAQQGVDEVTVTDALYQYVSDLVSTTRNPNDERLAQIIQVGLSPRASIGLIQLAKAKARLEQRTYVIPDDIKAVAHRVMRHRLILTYQAISQ